jgi:heme/copper-type cytochrome/quinol oxidase subunit 3
VLTTAMAYAAIRRGEQRLHREWMIRSYTVTFAFVTFRLIEKFILPLHLASDDEIDSMMAWASWSVPLLLVEPMLQWRRLRRTD